MTGRRGETEMAVRIDGQHAAARRALEQAALQQERLDHLLDRIALLGQRRGKRVDADRSAAIVRARRGGLGGS